MKYKIKVVIERDGYVLDERFYKIKCNTYEKARVIAFEKAKLDLPINSTIMEVI